MSTLSVAELDYLAEQIAKHIQGHLGARATQQLVDAKTLASELGVSRRWIYEHCDQLGVIALGSGTKPRLRFDREAAKTAMTRSSSEGSQAGNASNNGRSRKREVPRRRRLPNGVPQSGSVLTIRGADR